MNNAFAIGTADTERVHIITIGRDNCEEREKRFSDSGLSNVPTPLTDLRRLQDTETHGSFSRTKLNVQKPARDFENNPSKPETRIRFGRA